MNICLCRATLRKESVIIKASHTYAHACDVKTESSLLKARMHTHNTHPPTHACLALVSQAACFCFGACCSLVMLAGSSRDLKRVDESSRELKRASSSLKRLGESLSSRELKRLEESLFKRIKPSSTSSALSPHTLLALRVKRPLKTSQLALPCD